MVRVRGYGMHYINECPHEGRSTRMCVDVLRRRSPGSFAVITGCCLRSVIFRSPPSVGVADVLRTCNRIYLILANINAQSKRSSHGVLGRPAGFYSTSGKQSATVSGVSGIMEAWFLNQVLYVSVSVLLLGLQGLLGAGTPSNQWTESVAAGITYSTAADERNDTKNSSTSTLYPESLSPSQGDILLSLPAETHTAAAAAAGSFGKVTVTERPVVASGSLFGLP